MYFTLLLLVDLSARSSACKRIMLFDLKKRDNGPQRFELLITKATKFVLSFFHLPLSFLSLSFFFFFFLIVYEFTKMEIWDARNYKHVGRVGHR